MVNRNSRVIDGRIRKVGRIADGIAQSRPSDAWETTVGRFVDVQPGDDGCWLWTGPRFFGGNYGIAPDGRPVHRFVFEVLSGDIPEGMVLHHACQTPTCVNPAHLVPLAAGDHRAEHHALVDPSFRRVGDTCAANQSNKDGHEVWGDPDCRTDPPRDRAGLCMSHYQRWHKWRRKVAS